MLDLYTLITALLASLAVLLAAHACKMPTGVSIRDEYKAKYDTVAKREKIIFTLMGIGLCFLVGYAVTGELHMALMAGLGGVVVGRKLMERKTNAKRKLLRDQFANILASLTLAIKGGRSHIQALEDTAPSMPSPSREIFTEIIQRTRTGSTFTEATYEVAKETGWDDLRSLHVALDIYDATGCNLVDVFQYLMETIYERNSDRKYVEALTSQVRTSAALLSFLPFILIGVIRIISPEFASTLFKTPGGNAVILLCVVMVLIGNSVIKNMIVKTIGE